MISAESCLIYPSCIFRVMFHQKNPVTYPNWNYNFIRTQTYQTFPRHGGSFIILQKQYYYCYNSLPISHSMEKIFKIQGSCYKYKK